MPEHFDLGPTVVRLLACVVLFGVFFLLRVFYFYLVVVISLRCCVGLFCLFVCLFVIVVC